MNVQEHNYKTWIELGSPNPITNAIFYHCVGCKLNNLTTGNIRFVDNDVKRAKCYKCQDRREYAL